MHALFNKSAAKNSWEINACTLRSFAEYFGANTEQLDISSENGRATFMSYTEKVMNGRGLTSQLMIRSYLLNETDVLKQPLQTSVTIDKLDFEAFRVDEQLHIGISTKDFKAIVTHAETLKTNITAMYSFPTRPMQLSYCEHGMNCEFTLMTIGEYRGGSVTPGPAPVRQDSAASVERPPSRQSLTGASNQSKAIAMPPPSQPASRSFTNNTESHRPQRPSPPPPQASLDHETLFIPAEEDEDRVWGERNYDDDQDTLGWNASAKQVGSVVVIEVLCIHQEYIGSKSRSSSSCRMFFKTEALPACMGRRS